MISKRLEKIIEEAVMDDNRKETLQMLVISVLLACISIVMLIFNFIQKEKILFVVLVFFTALCFLSIWYLYQQKMGIPKVIMLLSTFSLFLFFLFTGAAQGISIFWLIMAPVGYLFFLGFYHGILVNSLLLIIMILSLWTPLNTYLAYEYTSVVKLRIPLIYTSIFLLASTQEYFRMKTHNKMIQLKSEFESMAMIDSLTKLPNRRNFEKSYLYLWQLSQRSGKDLSIMLLDIDSFKAYNDNYGHVSGDKILEKVGAILKEILLRSTDIVARYGGEEFVFILPYTGQKEAWILAEKIRNSLLQEEIEHKYKTTDPKVITVTIGIASYLSYPEEDRFALLDYADQAMYAGKEKGGNITVISGRQGYINDERKNDET